VIPSKNSLWDSGRKRKGKRKGIGGIGEAHSCSRWGGSGYTYFKEVAMRIKVKSLDEILSMALHKAMSMEKHQVRVYLPANTFPPKILRPYRVFNTEYYGVKVSLFLATREDGGWVVKVKFASLPAFNPVLKTEEAEKLKKLAK
jgi:hypothetical protein